MPLKLDGKKTGKKTSAALQRAIEWCEEEGVTCLEILLEADDKDKERLIQVLQLPNIPAKKLRKNLEKPRAPVPTALPESGGSRKLNEHI